MKYIRKLLCTVGLHSWEEGEGWIPIGNNVQAHFKGLRCPHCFLYDGDRDLTINARAYATQKETNNHV